MKTAEDKVIDILLKVSELNMDVETAFKKIKEQFQPKEQSSNPLQLTRGELILKAARYKQHTDNKDWESIPHLMADFALSLPKQDIRYPEKNPNYGLYKYWNGFNACIDEMKQLNKEGI
jgi:hypothetical protein